jgi:hypothetical protein
MRALAPAGEILFFAPPKKSIQKKGGPKACPLLDLQGRFAALPVRFSRKPAHAQLAISLRSKAQTGCMLHPVFTAMLGCAYGEGNTVGYALFFNAAD